MSFFPWAPFVLVEAGKEKPAGRYLRPPSAPPTGHRVLGWGSSLGVGRRNPSAPGLPYLLFHRLRPGTPRGPDPDSGRQCSLAWGVALASEPVAAAQGAPLWGSTGGREVASVCSTLFRHVSPALSALPQPTSAIWPQSP